MNRKQFLRQTLVLFCLFQFSFFIFNANAQVTIGADQEPQSYSLLELNTATVKGGIQLPKLTTTERDALLSSKTVAEKEVAKGLTIYNTTTDCFDVWNGTAWVSHCTGTIYNTTTDCFDVWNGTAWVSHCTGDSAPQITTQPRAFNWKETEGAGTLLGIGTDAATISVAATGIAPLAYQWYELTANTNAVPAPITGETAAAFTPDLSALGMRRYYCQVTDANGNSINSDIAEVAVGCGAKTVAGGWSTFMCYNLGATVTTIAAQKSTSSPVYTYGGTTASPADRNSAVYGDLYQWGRTTDGHEKRTSVTSTTTAPVGGLTAGTNTFLKITAYPYNWTSAPTADINWRNQKNGTYDPCPADWRIPAQGEWSDIFRGGSAPGAKATAVANTWEWYSTGGTNGYEIKPDGETTTLFLPAAGNRHNGNGELYNVGSNGLYWSGSLSSDYSLTLYFNGSSVYPAYLHSRSHGFSVRCIAEL
ncbi:hypothetical protein D0T49_11375 [Paludibacter sp. 221]|uniref:FISUMP domain-containing protein n=1 Tax=Paludibacter sp. 221 TaxID=2302939 RepID=UPI0013D18436|nr:FISUMP domain-containing protein [Paludibacter sp. 221]NDV47647.1 hypothetical protein [Paludibacter sp. 221]